ncbi:MAG: hypothetical protein ACKO3S_07175 [bacterium]
MRARAWVLVGALVALAANGCGGAHVPPPPPVGATSALPRVALLPLENLSARGDASDRIARVLVGVLGETRTCQPVPPGDVDAVFMELRIRDANGVTRDRVAEVASRLDAQWLMAGSVLEYGAVRTPEGEYPSVGVSLRLLDARDGRTAWSAMRVITGQDRESVFGMGRVRNLDQLTERLARELLAGFRLPTEDSKTAGGPR